MRLLQAEAGPEALQNLLKSSGEVQASTQAAHEQLAKLDNRLTATKAAVDAQSSLGEAAMAAAGDAGRAASALGARMDAESKRLTAYCDKVAQPLARSSQVRCCSVWALHSCIRLRFGGVRGTVPLLLLVLLSLTLKAAPPSSLLRVLRPIHIEVGVLLDRTFLFLGADVVAYSRCAVA